MDIEIKGLVRRLGEAPPAVVRATHKDCRRCLETKPMDDFPKHYAAADLRQNICKACTRKRRLQLQTQRKGT